MSKFSKVLLAAVFATVAASTAAEAATITYTLQINDNNGAGVASAPVGDVGKWSLYATVDADNAGIAAWGAKLTGATSPAGGTSTVRAPATSETDSNGINDPHGVGFTGNRVSDLVHAFSAAQDATGTGYVVTGMGQTAGDITAVAHTPGYDGFGSISGKNPYAAKILLAQGSYSVAAGQPAFDLTTDGLNNTKANLFVLGTTDGFHAANTIPAALVLRNTVVLGAVPEPATLGVLALGALCLIARRKKA